MNPEDAQPIKATDKSLEAMRHFSETYAKRTNTFFCVDPGVTAVVIEGLARHKDELGSPFAPAATTKIRRLKFMLVIGIAPASLCESVKNVTACSS